MRYHSMPHTKIFQFLKATPRKRVRYLFEKKNVIDTCLKKNRIKYTSNRAKMFKLLNFLFASNLTVMLHAQLYVVRTVNDYHPGSCLAPGDDDADEVIIAGSKARHCVV